MKNITVRLDAKLLTACRRHARERGMTLTAQVGKLLEQTVMRGAGEWVEEYFALMEKTQIPARAVKWTREDLYRV